MMADSGGKIIATNAGYGVGSGFRTVAQYCPNSKVLEGFSMKGGIERDGVYLAIKGEKAIEAEWRVGQWLQEIGIISSALNPWHAGNRVMVSDYPLCDLPSVRAS